MEKNCKYRCFRLLVLVILKENVMLSIVDRMVNARCIATTSGRRLFCLQPICQKLKTKSRLVKG
jgi:hypothetical protein